MVAIRMLRTIITGTGHQVIRRAGQVVEVGAHEATMWCLRGWSEPVEAHASGRVA